MHTPTANSYHHGKQWGRESRVKLLYVDYYYSKHIRWRGDLVCLFGEVRNLVFLMMVLLQERDGGRHPLALPQLAKGSIAFTASPITSGQGLSRIVVRTLALLVIMILGCLPRAVDAQQNVVDSSGLKALSIPADAVGSCGVTQNVGNEVSTSSSLLTFHVATPRNDRSISLTNDSKKHLTVYVETVLGRAAEKSTLRTIAARIDSVGLIDGFVQYVNTDGVKPVAVTEPLGELERERVPIVIRWMKKRCQVVL